MPASGLGAPLRRNFRDDLNIGMAHDGFLEARVAFLAIDGAQRSLKIDDLSRLVADQSDESLACGQTVSGRVAADVGVDSIQFGWRTVPP